MTPLATTLLRLLDGATHCNAAMPWGQPGPIELPADADERAELIKAHLAGGPATVLYSPAGRLPEPMHVPALSLAALTPRADGRCSWLGIDLDAAAGHGAGGLLDPNAAARALAERADNAGLSAGLLAARSRGGRGVHLWLLLDSPQPLADCVVAAAALAAQAVAVAGADVADGAPRHAFATGTGGVAEPGAAGACELFPRSSTRPPLGWALALPRAGAFASKGGGVVLDPFTLQPAELADVPACDAKHWARFVREAFDELRRKRPPAPRPAPRAPRRDRDPLANLDPKARQFLAGQTAEGARAIACFATSCALLGRGVSEHETERLVLAGAAGCGLPEREARTAFASAVGTMRRKGLRR